MKYKILLSVFSLIAAIIMTLVCWWICGCPKVQSDVDAFLLMLSALNGTFTVGSRVKIVDIDPIRGYAIEDKHSNRLVEIGWII